MNSNYPTREYIVRETLYPFGATVKEVVGELARCKDCKYSYTMITARSKDGQERWTRFCDKHKTLFPEDDWFCKDGERKEE